MRRIVLTSVAVVSLLIGAAVFPSAVDASSHSEFTPDADSYVDASHSTRNYGTRAFLRIDNTPLRTTYIRFDVTGVGPSPGGAVLRLYAESSSNVGFDVYAVADNSWTETGITATNAPALGSLIASSGPISGGTFQDVDVSSEITGDGLVTPCGADDIEHGGEVHES